MSRSLFVSGLSPRTTIEDLEPVFREYGRLKDVYIPRDYYTREPRGFAYIEYPCFKNFSRDIKYYDERDCEEAYRRGNFSVHGRDLTVEFARGSRKTPREMRGGHRYTPSRRPQRYSSPDRSYRPRRDSHSPRRNHSRSPQDYKKYQNGEETRRSTRQRSRSRSLNRHPEHQRRSANNTNGHPKSRPGSPSSIVPVALSIPRAKTSTTATGPSPKSLELNMDLPAA